MLCSEDLASANDTFRYALSNTIKYHVLKRSYDVLKDKSYFEIIKQSIAPILIFLSELPASKEAGFRRRHSKDTGFEPAGSLFSCLSG